MTDDSKAGLNEALIAAARAADVSALRLLLDRDAEPDAHGATHETPLLAAIRHGQLESIRVLLAAGADPDLCGGNVLHGIQVSPLQEAASLGLTQVVQLLLESGADPEAPDILGHGEAVFQAARRGHEEVARVIRDHISRSRRRKQREYFESHGYSILPDRSERFQLYLSGSQVLPSPDTIMPLVVRTRSEAAPDIPLTVFDGSFEQIFPSLLTQELGGNTFTKGVGSWLRRAGVNGLIYPSARCDASLTLTDGIVTGFRGWNLVDYRDAEPPQPQVFLDVDDYWPDRVRMGPGMGTRPDLPTDLFKNVSVDFVRGGSHDGSFEVNGLESSAQHLYELEISALRERRPFKPWWQL